MNIKTKKSRLILGAGFGVLFLIHILLIKTVDVARIGPQGTSVGFATINKAFNELTGLNMFWYYLTQVLGFLAIAIVVLFAVIGVLQLIKRRDIRKVDQCILSAGVLYAVMFVFYVIFEKVVINYRPVIMPDETAPEASFPSSHTMLFCVVIGSVMALLPQYIDDKHSGKIIRIVCAVLMALAVFGRLICGVHWLTDIVGGVLLSAALVMVFLAFMKPRKASVKASR